MAVKKLGERAKKRVRGGISSVDMNPSQFMSVPFLVLQLYFTFGPSSAVHRVSSRSRAGERGRYERSAWSRPKLPESYRFLIASA